MELYHPLAAVVVQPGEELTLMTLSAYLPLDLRSRLECLSTFTRLLVPFLLFP